MITQSRRVFAANGATFLAVFLTLFAAFAPAEARTVVDSSGRSVAIPDAVHRVFVAGPPAAVLLYVLKPDAMTGWVRPVRPNDKPYLLPGVRDLPQSGRLTGRGDTVNPEVLVASNPDLIFDFGTINDTYKSLADRVQMQTHIPYILIDGRFDATPAALRLLGDILGVKERGELLARYTEGVFAKVDKVLAAVPQTARPRVYLARGPNGLETGTHGSINTEIIERVGAVNVVEGFGARGGLVDASPEQILSWAPDTIITLDRSFAGTIKAKPEWQDVPAVKSGRVFIAPDAPFGFIDNPPSVNRLAGIIWLLHEFYPKQAPGDLKSDIAEFYKLFYQTNLSNDDAGKLLTTGG